MENNVDEFMRTCASRVARSSYDDFIVGTHYHLYSKNIESPIEQIMFIALTTIIKVNKLRLGDEYIEIIPQFKIDKYRADFKIEYKDKSILIECDSQQFHERSENERRYEKARDRYLKMKGMEIFHYTGKEIIENALEKALEILKYITQRDDLEDNCEILGFEKWEIVCQE